RVTPAPSGSELKSGDTTGNMIQLRIPIGTAARAQMPRILPREYCSPISPVAFARAVVSIFSSCIHPDAYGIKSCGYCARPLEETFLPTLDQAADRRSPIPRVDFASPARRTCALPPR